MTIDWAWLDGSARSQLKPLGLADYEETKAALLARGESDAEIELILTGLIWNWLDAYSAEDYANSNP